MRHHAPSQKVGLERLAQVADTSGAMVGEIRRRALAPTNIKKQPVFTPADLNELLGKGDDWMEYRRLRCDPPMPERVGARWYYSLESVQHWCRKERGHMLRPEGQEGLVLCVGNFKGGSAKTTTAATLAQGLSIRGHKVLVIDVDGQGSLSNLFGVVPDIDEVQTILPVCDGTATDVLPMVMATYWTGIDMIAADKTLSLADTVLPTQENYWLLLRQALANARQKYDVIVIDTSPNLNPLTATCLMASDALIMPVTPNALDFSSSAQYWGLFADMCDDFARLGVADMSYEFVRIVLSRVDTMDRGNVALIRGLMQRAYGDFLMTDVEIPKSSITTGASITFGTVFDAPAFKIPRRTLLNARAPYERFVNAVEEAICNAWARRVQEAQQTTQAA